MTPQQKTDWMMVQVHADSLPEFERLMEFFRTFAGYTPVEGKTLKSKTGRGDGPQGDYEERHFTKAIGK